MLYNQIQSDLKEAMIAKDEAKISTLRLLLSAIRYTATGADQEFADNDVVAVIQKELKKRQEAAESFRSGGREESAGKEEAEATILTGYLPAQLSDQELTRLVQESINEVGASSIADMGRVMGSVLAKVGSKASPSRVSQIVKVKLS